MDKQGLLMLGLGSQVKVSGSGGLSVSSHRAGEEREQKKRKKKKKNPLDTMELLAK